MNSQLDIVICGSPEFVCNEVSNKITTMLIDLELILSRYNPNAELSKLNINALNKPVEISTVLLKAILSGLQYYTMTNGYFNILHGKAFHGIKNGSQVSGIPSTKLENCIQIDLIQNLIYFTDENVLIDLGGLGKGIALKEIDLLLTTYSITNAFISFGGSSILTKGCHPHGNFWPFRLTDNEISSKIWVLNDSSISVSSSYRKDLNGYNWHILNPKTNMAVENIKTSVVISKDPVDAEALSTALIVAPEWEHQKIIQNFNNIEVEVI
jgi:FAD:protein FMN transferase